MSLDALKAKIPDYAKDIKLNLASLLGGIERVSLSPSQVAALALSGAYATRQITVIRALEAFAEQKKLSDEGKQAAKTAASLMAMNNIYYRSVHFAQGETYAQLPANLRMHMLQKHGMAQQEFELCCVVVSAINGCGRCIAAHIAVLEKEGIGTAEIHYSLRLAAVLHGVAQVLTIEEASE